MDSEVAGTLQIAAILRNAELGRSGFANWKLFLRDLILDDDEGCHKALEKVNGRGLRVVGEKPLLRGSKR